MQVSKTTSKPFLFFAILRPANDVTAVADILGGVAIAFGSVQMAFLPFNYDMLLLAVATIGLYGGGIVFNDIFDIDTDRIERPERLLPSGYISVSAAVRLAVFCFLLAIVLSFLVNVVAGMLAIAISLSALLYDKWGKHHSLLGPLNMGLCRGLNLLLGMSIIPSAISGHWFLAIVPMVYIAAITMISRGEVHGGNKQTMYMAAFFYSLVLLSVYFFSWQNGAASWLTIAFLLVFALLVFRPLVHAIRQPSAPNIGKAVKTGILCLPILNALWALSAGNLTFALLILALLPVSVALGRVFPVT